MTSSSPLLSLVLLLASSAGPLSAAAHVDDAGERGLTRIHMYLHGAERHDGRRRAVAAGRQRDLGRLAVLDLELRDGPDPSNSALVGRYQGTFAFADRASPPGILTTVNFVFTAGEHAGSTLAVLGRITSFEESFERAVVGGTGAFRMARGYCVTRAVANPTPESVVYEVHLSVKTDA